jgi:hypothetical protein
MSKSKSQRQLARLAKRLGYASISITRRGHLLCQHAVTGAVVLVAPPRGADPHTGRAIEHRLRRAAGATGGAS